jgi:outer membrane biosynthesis protein TonB
MVVASAVGAIFAVKVMGGESPEAPTPTGPKPRDWKAPEGEDVPAPEPTPAPEAEPKAKPAAKPAPTPTSAPEPAAPKPKAASKPKAAKPAKASKPAPTSASTTVNGVTVPDPEATLLLANVANEAQLTEAGIKGRAATSLVEGRPFADLEQLGNTKGVGKKTLEALVQAS